MPFAFPNLVSMKHRALLVGANGGVGRAVLSLLTRTAVGRQVLSSLDALLLVDEARCDDDLPVPGATRLPPTRIGTAEDLARLVRDHRITQVLDLSSLDTVECTEVCDALGADFLCTSVEEWPERGLVPTDEAIRRLVPPRGPRLTRRSHLVGSGANPGLVNALVTAGLGELARRTGRPATTDALGIHAILITEHDTTREEGHLPNDVFAMTWSPSQCLAELLEPRAFFVSSGRVVDAGHAPTSRRYRARCAGRIIEGLLVPHEEIVTLARRLDDVELGFIYRLPRPARRAIAAYPDRDVPELWPVHRLYPPWATRLAGRDSLGVLLCSRRFGELWIGFETDVGAALRFGMNATQLQVAAGVLAGWSQLGHRRGIHFVEDLDCTRFLECAAGLLGPPSVVHDRSAPPTHMPDRAEPGRRPLPVVRTALTASELCER